MKSLNIKLLCCLFTYCQSFTNFCNHQTVISQSAPLKLYTPSILECHLLSINMWSIWFGIFPSAEVQVYCRKFRCRNTVFLTIRFCDVAKFTILTPLSLLSWYRPSFPIVSLKIFSLLTFTLKSPNINFIWYLRKWSQTCSNTNCLLNHHFSPHLGNAHSKQWYYTSNLSELNMTPYH